MIKIAVCDDKLEELEYAHEILKNYNLEYPQYELKVELFSAPLELLSFVEEYGGFDVILLDIYMDGILGIEAAKQLRQIDDKGEIIFLTSSKDHAIEAFEVEAVQYLVKPYTEISLFLALDKVLKWLKLERRHIITVKTSKGLMRLYARNVLYTETGKNNYQVIHTIKGEKIELRMSATELFTILSKTDNFVRCGASITVNLKFIRQIKKEAIVFDTGEQISYPHRACKTLKKDFLDYQMTVSE